MADNEDEECKEPLCRSDYRNVNIFMVYFLQTYRNSIGDIAAPDYSFWTTRGAAGELYSSRIMVFFVWLLWFANQFFVLIILLNFLIAIISQKYEQVMAQSIVHKYEHKIDMNRSYCLVTKAFGKLKPLECQVLTVQPETGQDAEWTGFVSTVTKFISSQTEMGLVKQALKVRATSVHMEQRIKAAAEDLKTHVNKTVTGVEKEMKRIAGEVADQNALLGDLFIEIKKGGY